MSINSKDLEGAYLRRANLEGADLRRADLRRADLYGANLRRANLEGANLEGADLKGAYLKVANLEGADLKVANLEGADLRGANLKGAYLKVANLEGANLEGADLKGADLKGAYLRGANLENSVIESPTMESLGFTRVENGWIGFKSFGEMYSSPDSWVIEENSTIEESNLEKDLRITCGPGINVGTKEWCSTNVGSTLWEILIPDESTLVIPYGTDGKVRTDKAIILRKVT